MAGKSKRGVKPRGEVSREPVAGQLGLFVPEVRRSAPVAEAAPAAGEDATRRTNETAEQAPAD